MPAAGLRRACVWQKAEALSARLSAHLRRGGSSRTHARRPDMPAPTRAQSNPARPTTSSSITRESIASSTGLAKRSQLVRATPLRSTVGLLISEAAISSSSKVERLLSRSAPGTAGAAPSSTACSSASAAATAAATILSTCCRFGSGISALANAEVGASATPASSVEAIILSQGTPA